MFFVCYPRCTTCKKAQKWLDDNAIAYELRDIRTQNPTADELQLWQERSGLNLKRFWNTSGIPYRALKIKEKLADMNNEEQLQLLATDGMLVKRPLLVSEDFVLVGFRESEWKEKIPQKSPEC